MKPVSNQNKIIESIREPSDYIQSCQAPICVFEPQEEYKSRLPVIIFNVEDKTEIINIALDLHNKLEHLAAEQEKRSGKYIRHGVLFYIDEEKNGGNNYFEKLKEKLLSAGISQEKIKINAETNEGLPEPYLMNNDSQACYFISSGDFMRISDNPFINIIVLLTDQAQEGSIERAAGCISQQADSIKQPGNMLSYFYLLTAFLKFKDMLPGIQKELYESGISADNCKWIDEADEKKKSNIEKLMYRYLFPDHKMQTEKIETNENLLDKIKNVKEERTASYLSKIEKAVKNDKR